MRIRLRLVTPLMLATLAAAPLVVSGCAGHRTYDPYYGDYHRWNSSEDGFYRQWEGERGLSHLDFGMRSPGDQQAYFGWRHRR